jgi:SAM-dependent methyltransferase
VLDVGCGPGHLTAHLRSLGVDSVGIDVVPEFIDHARVTYPDGRYALGSMRQLPVSDDAVAGILAWYSLIHAAPQDLDRVLVELGRAMAPTGTLVVGFFDGDDVVPFEHKVTTAYYWPVDDFCVRLQRNGSRFKRARLLGGVLRLGRGGRLRDTWSDASRRRLELAGRA